MTHSLRTETLDAFGYEPPETGANLAAETYTQQKTQLVINPADALRERVKATLIAHCERAQTTQPKHRQKREVRGPLSVGPTPEPKAKRTDLNKICRNWMDKKGWKHYRVDVWNSFAGVANDLFGVFDYLAFDLATGQTIGVQVTARANMSARRKKMLGSPWLPILKSCGWRCVLVGFEKGANGRYEAREEDV